jgi:hypothetical protein
MDQAMLNDYPEENHDMKAKIRPFIWILAILVAAIFARLIGGSNFMLAQSMSPDPCPCPYPRKTPCPDPYPCPYPCPYNCWGITLPQPLNDEISQDLECANPVNTQNLAPELRDDVLPKFISALHREGIAAEVNSGYRTKAFQGHLLDTVIYMQAFLPFRSECPSFVNWLECEIRKHKLGSLVGDPNTSKHCKNPSQAVDIGGLGGTNNDEKIKHILDTDIGLNGRLIWRYYYPPGALGPLVIGERMHFELKSPAAMTLPEQTRPAARLAYMATALVQVTGSMKVVGATYVYQYILINNTAQPVTAFYLGANISTGSSELTVPPLGWSPDNSLPPGSLTSPPGWTPWFITREESFTAQLGWYCQLPEYRAIPGSTLTGFSVLLDEPAREYLTGHFSVVLGDTSIVTGVISYPVTLPLLLLME